MEERVKMGLKNGEFGRNWCSFLTFWGQVIQPHAVPIEEFFDILSRKA